MPYKKSKISLSASGQFSKLITDYVNGDSKLRKFYMYEPNIASFAEAITDRSQKSIDRELLVSVLQEQYKSGIKAASSDLTKTSVNIELLLNKNTYTVCTGHQLCLFTGPLYFIYKIISTINLAEALKKEYPQQDFVPVYWMASEDHDFAEISSVHVFGKTVSWNNPEAKGAVGRLNTASLEPVIAELKTILGESEHVNELIKLFSDAYLKHTNLADATRFLVHELFGAYGLVIIDADDAKLKEQFLEIVKDDISNSTNYKLVNQSIEELEKMGVKPQVNPREINVFHMKDDRVRIEKASAEILNLQPEEYSPNVVLRPLYQQMILPNLAYIGGPGEIAYWLEYKAMFDHHQVQFPVLMLRNFALLTDEKTVQQIKKLGFSTEDLFGETEQLIKEFVNKNSNGGLSLKEEEEKLSAVYGEISAKAAAIDPTLKGSVEAELQKALNALKNIEGKLMRSEKQKQETGINQLKKLKDKFFPESSLQERYENMSPYYLKSGKQLITGLKEAFQPFEFEMLILEMN